MGGKLSEKTALGRFWLWSEVTWAVNPKTKNSGHLEGNRPLDLEFPINLALPEAGLCAPRAPVLHPLPRARCDRFESQHGAQILPFGLGRTFPSFKPSAQSLQRRAAAVKIHEISYFLIFYLFKYSKFTIYRFYSFFSGEDNPGDETRSEWPRWATLFLSDYLLSPTIRLSY